MIIATGIIALTRKVNDERAKKKELKQGRLSIGNSKVAQQAFQYELSKNDTQIATTESDPCDELKRSDTKIRWEDANAISTPDSSQHPSATTEPIPPLYDDIKHSIQPQSQVSSPVYPVSSPVSSPTFSQPTILDSAELPYYSEKASSKYPSQSSVYSSDLSSKTTSNSDTRSTSTDDTDSRLSSVIRVKTKGSDLDSGFPYHPALFDCKVHPEKWDMFTTQVIETTKVGGRDKAQIWAASAATALTGAIATSIWLGRSMSRQAREKKVKTGLSDMRGGALGDTLLQWNDHYFHQRGLYVHLELSEAVMKTSNQRSTSFQKSHLLYSSREDRDKKRDERKYIIVVTRLDDQGAPSEAIKQVKSAMDHMNVAELPAEQNLSASIPELAGEGFQEPVELPAMELPGGVSLGYDTRFAPLAGYAELDSRGLQAEEVTR